MSNWETAKDVFDRVKTLILQQPEDEQSFYDPHINSVRAILEQPYLPPDFVDFVVQHCEKLEEQLQHSVPPARVRKLLDSVPRMEDLS